MFFDTHTHLSDEKLENNINEIVAKFKNNGVEKIIEVGFDLENSRKTVKLANKYDFIYSAVGIHPHLAFKTTPAELYSLAELAKSAKVVALGEIGLDYYYNENHAEQINLLKAQLEIADFAKLPIILHLRDATEDMLKTLEDCKKFINNGMLLHCYTGSAETAKLFAKKYDNYFAFGGAITFKNANKKDVINSINKERLLLETDCPYMTPVPFRGQINDPNNIKFIAEKMAEFIEMNVENVGKMTYQNAIRFFRI